jgi:hypothetical protein
MTTSSRRDRIVMERVSIHVGFPCKSRDQRLVLPGWSTSGCEHPPVTAARECVSCWVRRRLRWQAASVTSNTTEPRPGVPRRPPQFPAWVWDPTTPLRARGFMTADLFVYQGALVAWPRKIGAALARIPPVDYRWPTVVVQRLVWFHGTMFPAWASVLVEVQGKLGSVTVPFGARNRLADVLSEAGFDVVQVVRRGWEAPQALAPTDYPKLVGRVPACILRNA